MAETTETVVFEINVESYEKSLADLTKSINGLKDTQAQLAKEAQTGNELSAKSLEKVNAQIKIEQQEYRTMQNVLVGYNGAKQKEVSVTNFSKNSIQANRDLLKQLTAQYINTKQPSEQFTNQIKKLSEALKQQEAAIGDTRRNVGNYAGDLVKYFGGGRLGSVAEGFGIISKNISGVAGSLGVFKTALLTSGIGGLALAVGGIVTYFKSFEDGAELLERKIAGLGAVADVAISKFGQFGKSIIDSLGASTQRSFADNVKGITTSIKDGLLAQGEGVLNTYKALGKVIGSFGKEGAAELQDAILQTITFGTVSRKAIADTIDESARAFKQAEEFTRQIQVLEEAEREYGLTVSKNSIEVDRLRIAARSRGLDFESQLRLLAEAGRLEEINIGIERKNAEERLRIIKEQTDIKRRQGTVTEKVTQEEFDAQVKLDGIKRSSILLTEKINNQIDSVLEQRRASNLKEYEEFVAGINAANAALTKGAIDAENTFVKIKDNSVQQLREHIKKKNAEYAKGIADELKLEQDKERAKQSIISAGFEFASNALNSIAQAVIDNSNQELENDAAANEEKKKNLEDRLNSGEISKKEYDAKILALDKEFNEKESAEKRKQWEISKGIQITNAIIQTAQAVISGLNAGLSLGPAGVVLGPVLAALAAATGAIQIGIISAQQPPKFAEGGGIDIDGKPHSQGGTPIHVNGRLVAEAEQGEGLFVMKKNAYQNLDRLSEWNQLHGGVSWNTRTRHAAFGGEIPISDGGFSTRQIANSVNNEIAMKQAIREGFAKAPAPELSIVELNSKQSSRNRSITISEM